MTPGLQETFKRRGALMSHQHKFYGELAPWWPLISPPEDYLDDARQALGLLASASIPACSVLELGSGGGHTASHLKNRFTMTLVDSSADMIEMSVRLNPECLHVVGDMRSVRLGTLFDAVFIHDAIDYMTTEEDLLKALRTAALHVRPGGVAVIMPDDVLEQFSATMDCGGHDDATGRGVRYLEWTWDPDPTDSWVQTEYSFVLRNADGTVTATHESHRFGVFPQETWLRLLRESGLRPRAVPEDTSEARTPRTFFVATKTA
jgi:trans-aconitate methyltransferase